MRNLDKIELPLQQAYFLLSTFAQVDCIVTVHHAVLCTIANHMIKSRGLSVVRHCRWITASATQSWSNSYIYLSIAVDVSKFVTNLGSQTSGDKTPDTTLRHCMVSSVHFDNSLLVAVCFLELHKRSFYPAMFV